MAIVEKIPQCLDRSTAWAGAVFACKHCFLRMFHKYSSILAKHWFSHGGRYKYVLAIFANVALGILLLQPLLINADEVKAASAVSAASAVKAASTVQETTTVEAASAVNAASTVGAASAVNAASSVEAASAVGAASANENSAMDPSRNYVSGKLESWAKSLDGFFGDYRNYQESNDSVIQLEETVVSEYEGPLRVSRAFNFKISLPNTERKMKFLIETNPDEKTIAAPSKVQPRPVNTPTTPGTIAAALRYERSEAERWHFSTDGGIQLAGLASTPFVRARLSLAMPLDNWQMKVAETVFWFNTIGAGETTVVDFDRPLNKVLLFRASSNATWLNSNQYYDLNQSFTIYHTWDPRTAVLYQVSATGVSKPEPQVTDYVILTSYRYRLHREWVFLEISPQIHFPMAVDYKTTLLLSVKLEVLFDKSR